MAALLGLVCAAFQRLEVAAVSGQVELCGHSMDGSPCIVSSASLPWISYNVERGFRAARHPSVIEQNVNHIRVLANRSVSRDKFSTSARQPSQGFGGLNKSLSSSWVGELVSESSLKISKFTADPLSAVWYQWDHHFQPPSRPPCTPQLYLPLFLPKYYLQSLPRALRASGASGAARAPVPLLPSARAA
ncbi:hypothetical protein BT67DRAFT_481654 [Trichocladium antarcticum]|uniref:Uncharacterized protein n=1 Tax=Trichocladium antarcticum TaxID=1450529 RepID=A0AAN6ZBQ2_9PEZI|nr:hypothetical protein BT67DRAFT_481654 [Trichocladium antarcticum]